ncbi:VOC family protein [Nitrosarchaeum sp. AC2]|uniref:VOC family protein n=1 Tax=Nitrosarchaeum sp. AC2 TaxID=2259673 RepID=UPI0015C98050|nr:VOC family protein [Nitrosarchaeum sp. AC2]QLH11035.1 VOC family protein [Nitrosarchaeum sp. AC2]
MIPIDQNTRIGQVHLNVSNINQSLEFYKSFLGFKIVEQTEHVVFLSSDGNLPYLVALSTAKPLDLTKRAGLYHFAILLPKRKDLAEFLSHLLKHKDTIKIDGFSDHLVSEAIYIRDPDNIGIEIYRDRIPSEWKWIENQVVMAIEPLDMEGLLAESTKSWSGFPSDTSIGHVHLHVSNLANAKKFYSEILGLTTTASMKGALFFAAGKYHHHIATNTWLGEDISQASTEFAGLDYFTLQFSSKDKLNYMIRKLESSKITVKSLEDGSFSIFDEDKISIHLTVK